jgi:tetratricopeptide (TPR) repeat protein
MAREPEAVVRLRRALGERLATFRRVAGLTQGQLADATICDRTNVVHIEKGRNRGDERFWSKADEGCNAGGVLLAGFHELAAAKAEYEHDIRVRELDDARAKADRLRQGNDGRLLPAITQPLDPDEQARIAGLQARPRSVDRAALRSLTTMLAEQRRLEDVVGARPLVQPMRAQLRLVESIVVDARGAIRADVVDVGSQFAQFTAWLHASLGEERAGRYFYDRATEWALEIDDPHMVATALSMKGHVAYRQRQLNSMLGLSRAAQRDRRLSPGIRALAVQQEARALALLGERDATERRLDDAFVLAEQAVAHPEDEPPWVYFYSPEYFMMQRGRAYRYLGRFDEAAELLDAGLNALAPELRSAEWAEGYHADLRVVRERLG